MAFPDDQAPTGFSKKDMVMSGHGGHRIIDHNLLSAKSKGHHDAGVYAGCSSRGWSILQQYISESRMKYVLGSAKGRHKLLHPSITGLQAFWVYSILQVDWANLQLQCRQSCHSRQLAMV